MNRQQFYQWMKDPALLDKESLAELRLLVDEYPFFQSARLLYLLNLKLLNDYHFEQELHRVAVYVADRSKLREWIAETGDPESSGSRKKDRSPSRSYSRELLPSPDNLKSIEEQIRANLEEIERKQSELRELIEEKKALSADSAKADDVSARKERTGSFRPLPKDDLLEEFIRDQQIQPQNRTQFYNPEDSARKSIEENDGFLSETLARLVAAQGKKDRAIKIYQQLMLKNPQKSSYFAAQIEKLRKEP